MRQRYTIFFVYANKMKKKSNISKYFTSNNDFFLFYCLKTRKLNVVFAVIDDIFRQSLENKKNLL